MLKHSPMPSLQSRGTRLEQRGAALAIGLILLAVASLVTVASLSTGVMQNRMASNQDNNARSFKAAEAGGASLVRWFSDNDWPTAARFPSMSTSRMISNDPSINYTLTRLNPSQPWTTSPLLFEVEGRSLSADGSAVLARTRLLVEIQQSAPAPRTTAPAAISCFNGPCTIIAGAGRGSDLGFGTISGFNHPVPPSGCSGSGCRMQPQGADRDMPAVPAVYLGHPSGSRLEVDGGSGFNAFQGLNRTRDGVSRANNTNGATFPSHFPSNAPTMDSAFGSTPPPTQSSLESGRSGFTTLGGSDEESGTLVINGGEVRIQGNALFVGLIVIRNCGRLRLSGNPNIYGAVIVDATGCPPGYQAVVGNGTPAIRFSRTALDTAHGRATDPDENTFRVVRWVELIE